MDDDLDKGQRGGRPTLKTISRITGLAVATVSRALHDAPDISADTKRRVQECADKVGYRPNRAGVRLRTGKTNVISLVLSTDHDVMNHTARLISSIAGGLRETPYHLIVTPFFPGEDPMKPVLYLTETGSADAIILNQIEPEDPRIAHLMKIGFPFATHGRTIWSKHHAYADFSNRAFGELGVDILSKRNRTSLMIIAPPHHQTYGADFVKGVQTGCDATGLSYCAPPDISSDSPSQDIYDATRRLLADRKDIDGVICASTTAAMAAVAALEDSGYVIGDTVDVVAKEAISFLKRFRKEIITVAEDVAGVGDFLAKAAIQAIDEPRKPPMQRLDIPTLEDQTPATGLAPFSPHRIITPTG